MPEDDLPPPTGEEAAAGADDAPATDAGATDDGGSGPTPGPEGGAADAEARKAYDDFHAKHPTDEAKGKAYWNAANELARVTREKEALERERAAPPPPAPEEPPDEDEIAEIDSKLKLAETEERAIVETLNDLAAQGRELQSKINRLEGRLEGTDSREEEARTVIQRQIDEFRREHKGLGDKYRKLANTDLEKAKVETARAKREKDKTSKRVESAQKRQQDDAKKERQAAAQLAEDTLDYIDHYIDELKIPKDDRDDCHETVLSRTMRAAYKAAGQGKLLNVQNYVKAQVEAYKGRRDSVERDVLRRQADPKGAAANPPKPGGGGRPSAPARDPKAPPLLKHEQARENFINGGARK